MGCNTAKDSACANQVSENPQHKVSLSPYFIDITEVTAAEYKKCVDAGGCSAPGGENVSSYANWSTAGNKPQAGREQHPLNCVTWTDSQKFCKWRGSKVDAANASKYDLPTDAQWEMAARGSCEKNGSAASNDAACKAAMGLTPGVSSWRRAAMRSCTPASIGAAAPTPQRQ